MSYEFFKHIQQAVWTLNCNGLGFTCTLIWIILQVFELNKFPFPKNWWISDIYFWTVGYTWSDFTVCPFIWANLALKQIFNWMTSAPPLALSSWGWTGNTRSLEGTGFNSTTLDFFAMMTIDKLVFYDISNWHRNYFWGVYLNLERQLQQTSKTVKEK